jgi:hypothetical protein
MDNFFSCLERCVPCNVKLRKHGGAFWGQSMTKVFERTIEQDNPDLILTIDYDSVMTAGASVPNDPDDDALSRDRRAGADPVFAASQTTLFTVAAATARTLPALPRTALDGDTMPVSTAHFGLTLIRTEAIKKMAKPWFHSVPFARRRLGRGARRR